MYIYKVCETNGSQIHKQPEVMYVCVMCNIYRYIKISINKIDFFSVEQNAIREIINIKEEYKKEKKLM